VGSDRGEQGGPVATFWSSTGLIGGGAGMSSPSNARARKQAAAPNLRTGVAEIAQRKPSCSMSTMKMTAPAATGKLRRVWQSSDQVRRINGAPITRRSGDGAHSVMS
jgi:hypothetical protein